MKDLSVIVLSENELLLSQQNPNLLFTNAKNLVKTVKSANSKYIVFTKDTDGITEDYLSVLMEKCKDNFDCCFINYVVNYDYKNEIKVISNEGELKKYKPYRGEYIWNFIFSKEKFLKIIEYIDSENFNEMVDSIFEKISAIGKVLYYHNPQSERVLNNFCFSDVKRSEYYKNIIYFKNGCNGVFNGYISWVKNIGRCFSNKYDITILYDNIPETTLKLFSQYFNCVKRDLTTNYVTNRLLTVYSEFFYPKNIFTLDENYTFIHGNMSDYENVIKYYDDIYTKYIAVSEVAAKKAIGYFPTNNIDFILNPFKIDSNLLKPHLKLVSAHRFDKVKGCHRVEILAEVLNALDIPFTWNVFTDKYEGTNKNGIIYRNRVNNPLPYIKDSDYFVLLSDSEACPYSALEALSLNTKVICTPLDAFYELGVKNEENGFIIPFEYFEPENRDKLVDMVLKIYNEKEKEFDYEYNETKFGGYHDIFIE